MGADPRARDGLCRAADAGLSGLARRGRRLVAGDERTARTCCAIMAGSWAAASAHSTTSSGPMRAITIRPTRRWSPPSPKGSSAWRPSNCIRRIMAGQLRAGFLAWCQLARRGQRLYGQEGLRRGGGCLPGCGRPPAFLIESAYEFEHDAGAAQVRRQAYTALLCGASGQVLATIRSGISTMRASTPRRTRLVARARQRGRAEHDASGRSVPPACHGGSCSRTWTAR